MALGMLSLFFGYYEFHTHETVTNPYPTECHWSTYAKGRQKREDGKPCMTIIMYGKHSNVK